MKIPFINCNKKYLAIGLLGVLPSVGSLQAQTYPLSENSWDNPEFVNRFLGSYGILTDVEPKVTTAEHGVLSEVATMMAANQSDLAIESIKKAITAESSAAYEFTIANIYLQNGDYAQAETYYKQAVKKLPDFQRAYRYLGLSYVQQGKFEDALKCLIKAIELGDRQGDTYGLLGYCYLNQGDYQTALDAYRIALITQPKNKDWKIGKAKCLSEVGLYREALAIFKELIAQDGGKTSYYISCANAHISLQEFNEAAKYLELVCRLGDAEKDTYLLLGDIYMNQNMVKLAYETYLKGMDQFQGIPAKTLLRSANAFIQRSAYDYAESYLQKIGDYAGDTFSEKDKLEFLNVQAEVALSTMKDDKAAQILEQVIDLDPMNGRAILLLADYYNNKKNDTETADFYYKRAEGISAVSVQAYVEHARAKVGQSKYGEAVKLLETAQSKEYKKNVADYLDAVRKAYEATR
ncbi:MAG: tetratricopeptide repeat protein [Opitutales bacterium]|nr:tetratricopeptide repeat protein [Opitutales bacterium]